MIPCPVGFYNPRPQQAGPEKCLKCRGGKYCGEVGGKNETGLCAKGFFCPAGSFFKKPAKNICPPGTYCPEVSPEVSVLCAGVIETD